MLCEFRGWGGVWYFNFSESRGYGVVKISLIEIYIVILIIYFCLDLRIGECLLDWRRRL